ncbi:CARDB domain-containing protein [Halobacterium wangiae]|uniref:CARDB domain-containing protein n=1 Tax=Halobacterium wangiae TaxID=2902623 RepID=UPI001E3D66FC|nr:CARDB domain-containing protein [Halobacterium wangiae]
MKRRHVLRVSGVLTTGAVAGCLGNNGGGGASEMGSQDGAEFEVRIESFDQEVEQGEETSVYFSVENSGELSGTQTVTFEVDGSDHDVLEAVQLEGGESINDKFTYSTGSGDPPEVELTIATNDESTTRTVTVIPRPPVEDIDIEIADVRDISTGLTSATIPVYLEIENSNPDREIPSPTVEYTGFINGEQVGSDQKVIPTIEPGAALTKEFGFTVNYSKLGSAVVSAIKDGTFTFRITGAIESDGTRVEFGESYEY